MARRDFGKNGTRPHSPAVSDKRPFYSKDRQDRKRRRHALHPGGEKGQCLTRLWDRERLRKAAAESPCRSPGT